GEKVANGTINRELGVLIKMLRLADEHRKLLRLPVIRKLKEPPPRSAFFEHDQYRAVRDALPADLPCAGDIADTYASRIQSEVLSLRWSQVDLAEGTLRLNPGETKNADGRVVWLTPELRASLTEQLKRVRVLERAIHAVVPYVFPHLRGRDPRVPHGPKRTI